jgi:hypothetical protein
MAEVTAAPTNAGIVDSAARYASCPGQLMAVECDSTKMVAPAGTMTRASSSPQSARRGRVIARVRFHATLCRPARRRPAIRTVGEGRRGQVWQREIDRGTRVPENRRDLELAQRLRFDLPVGPTRRGWKAVDVGHVHEAFAVLRCAEEEPLFLLHPFGALARSQLEHGLECIADVDAVRASNGG